MTAVTSHGLYVPPEILELILDFATPETLAQVRQVSTTTRDLVDTRPKLQNALFFTPQNPSSWLRLDTQREDGCAPQGGPPDAYETAIEPTLRTALQALGDSSEPDYLLVKPHPFLIPDPRSTVKESGCSTFTLADPKKLMTLRDSPWSIMLLTNPPRIRGMRVLRKAYSSEQAKDEDEIFVMTSILQQTNQFNDHTLGCITLALRKFLQAYHQYRQCVKLWTTRALPMLKPHSNGDMCFKTGTAEMKAEHERVLGELKALNFGHMKDVWAKSRDQVYQNGGGSGGVLLRRLRGWRRRQGR